MKECRRQKIKSELIKIRMEEKTLRWISGKTIKRKGKGWRNT